MNYTQSDAELIQAFEAELKRRFHDRSTAKHYVSDMHIFLRRHPGPLPEVNSQDIAAFVDHQREAGLAPSTIKRRVAALKTFFDFVADELPDWDRPNPASLRRHAGSQPHLLPRDLSNAEVEQFLPLIDNARDLAMVSLMLYGGLRVGEVATLRPADIAVPEDPTAPVRLRVMGKGRKERVVYLCPKGYEPLAAYLKAHPPVEAQAPIFRTRLGKPISVAGIQERVTHYAGASGVDATCHRLRHTFGRWMVEGNMPVLTLARLLGHVNVHTTQRYVDGADPQLRRHYEAAMAQQDAAGSAPAAPSQTPPTPAMEVASGPATVRREEPLLPDEANRMVQGPAWLRESVQGWLRQRWYSWKPSQREHHAQTRLSELRLFWQWQLERRPFGGWDELTAADIRAYMNAALARGLKAKTVKTRVDRVYEVLRYLQAQGQLSEIPERRPLALPEPLPRHLEPQEVVALAAEVRRRESVAQGAEWLDLALYYLLGHGGLRIGEALDLKLEDIDLTARRVRVREGKGRRDRVVYLTAKGCEVLRRYLETVPHAGQDLVLSWQGRPLSYEEAWGRVSRLGMAAGVEGLSPQRLRHTYATHLLNNGMSIEALRRLMGHDNLNTTLIYARLADTTLEQQYRKATEQTIAMTSAVNSI